MTVLNGNTPVIILCGGQGTRMKEETEFRPKPLVEIGGMPILWHIMKLYGHFGYKDFILPLGYKGYMIKDYFVNYEWMSNDFTLRLRSRDRIFHYNNEHAFEDWDVTFAETGITTNTGGRIKKVQRYVGGQRFLATYGDGVGDVDIEDLVRFHEANNAIATITGVHPLSTYGVLDVDDDRMVRGFKEKPRLEGWINAGFFVFEPEIFDYLDDDCILEQDPMRKLAAEKKLAVYFHDGFWKSMDTFKDAQTLNSMWDKGDRPWVIW